MYFRVYCNVKEIEAPDMETAREILKKSLEKFFGCFQSQRPLWRLRQESPRRLKLRKRRADTVQ
jgi:hypothetical protein